MEKKTDQIVAEAVKPFALLKEDVIARCKKHNACQPEFKRILSADDTQELLQVLKDNLVWCLNEKMLDADYLEQNFGKDLLCLNHIYTSGINAISLSEAKTVVESRGISQNTIESRESSQNTIESWESSTAHITDYGSVKTIYSIADGECPIIKHLTEKKVYIKTTGFTIEQIS